jgi:hypothetical protein
LLRCVLLDRIRQIGTNIRKRFGRHVLSLQRRNVVKFHHGGGNSRLQSRRARRNLLSRDGVDHAGRRRTGVHPNRGGYAIMKKLVSAAIEAPG